MGLFNKVFQGSPGVVVSSGSPFSPELGIDTISGIIYYSAGNGWQPITSGLGGSGEYLAATGNISPLATYTPEFPGLYTVNFYSISVNAPTNATMPECIVTFTDAQTLAVTSCTINSVVNVSSANYVNSDQLTINPAVGTLITVYTTGYGAGSGTALIYNAIVTIDANK